MTGWLRPRRLVSLVVLTLVWCGLWGNLSFANVAGGLVVAVAVLASGVGSPNEGGVRLGPLLRFAWLVLIDLVKSTVSVAVEIVTPTDRTDEAVIAVEVPREARDHLLLLSVAITLTPGTAVIDTDPDSGTLYLHLLHRRRRDVTVAHVEELVDLACAALPARSIGALP